MKTKWVETFKVRAFALLKIPLIFYVSPKVLSLSSTHCIIEIPLSWRTKNHLGCMYFGVLATGADLAAGMLAMEFIQSSKQKVELIFKDFHADFLKRAEGDVHFICEDGAKLQTLVNRAVSAQERVQDTLEIRACVPSKLGEEAVAKFRLTISLKKRT